MNVGIRYLGADTARFEGVGPASLPSAAAIVLTSSFLMALNRFGGLAIEAPRPFMRLVVIGIWAWLALGAVMWLATLASTRAKPTVDSLLTALAVVGRAHIALLALSIVLFVAAGALRLRWPGFVTAAYVLALWMPGALVAGIRSTTGLSWRSAVLAAGVPYLGWILIFGNHLRIQLGHLV